jgi:ribosomal protein S13
MKKNINYQFLTDIKGIGNSKACTILASIELSKRLNIKYEI